MPIDKSWPGYNKGTIPDDGFEWIWQEAIPADEPNRPVKVVTIPFGYEKRILPRGWQKTSENMPLELDIIFEKDVEIVMRDGVKVSYCAGDLYRTGTVRQPDVRYTPTYIALLIREERKSQSSCRTLHMAKEVPVRT